MGDDVMLNGVTLDDVTYDGQVGRDGHLSGGLGLLTDGMDGAQVNQLENSPQHRYE